ncbi:octanoyl-[GcvH]:protein N-octanoyltransferase [Geomicrobium halophilum]|uniref:Octanoyl-[GcvH]:protein N-octanoyltransferase n=1 Tax=Geomicrobium halophilum TaxID=549000 RepID=A0A841PZZ9_9BACL|nr:lipoate--protein ligase family protein [Geomicrobium halophilum]MBB6450542.1 octanoyl-[GcvH]:protein N-octanoyltransferase [Geomicrobium halophilum]
MTSVKSLQGKQWRWLDHSKAALYYSPLHSFAYDDTICESVGKEYSHPVVHTWVHHPTIVLGTQDSRLPYIHEAIKEQNEKGVEVIVRNSGGLAVYLDPGILNISLIMKDTKDLSIDTSYAIMHAFVQEMYNDSTKAIIAREIVGSYCPGNYDLSINGKKFAGISQRRLRNGISVQVYLAITGSGSERAEVVRDFYQTAGGEYRTSTPSVQPETMASLSELYQRPITVAESVERMLRVFGDYGMKLTKTSLSPNETHRFHKRLRLVTERNEKVLRD